MIFKPLVLLFFINTSAFASGFMQVANFTKIHGTVLSSKEKLKTGDELTEGMEITIPKKGDFAEIKFQNGHIIRFAEARVLVVTLNPKNTLLNLKKGKVFSAIKPLTQNETFEIKTKRLSSKALGTKFLLEETKKQSYLFVNEGVVLVKSTKGEVEVKKDEDLTSGNLKASLATKNMIHTTGLVFSEMLK